MPNDVEVYLAWSYERLAGLRADFVKVLDSEFIWQHEDTHVEEIIARIDAIVDLKRQRDGSRASKRGARCKLSSGSHPAKSRDGNRFVKA